MKSPLSRYRDAALAFSTHRRNKAGKSRIQVRNKEASPIPKEIRLETPAMNVGLEANTALLDCKTVHYPAEQILDKEFGSIPKHPDRIVICIYRVNHCQNRYNVTTPFLEYLLYKYPKSKTPMSDLMLFPFLKTKKSSSALSQGNALAKKLTGYALKCAGYRVMDTNVYMFYNLSSADQYSITNIRLLNRKTHLWWALIDEICNLRQVVSFRVHPSVYNLFFRNPILIYLETSLGRVDIPTVGYYGNYYKLIPIIATLGQKATTANAILGPYYYFGTFRKAVRYAGWTSSYGPRDIYGERVTNNEGKYKQGGLVRFALFMGDMKVILDQPRDKLADYLSGKSKWAANFDSLYIGRVPLENGGVYTANPEYIAKQFHQQIPLSMHLLDMDSLKVTWDPTYDGYTIK